MRIAYYMPLKPLGNSKPSGDLIIGTELHNFLLGCGHEIVIPSRFRSRWFYLRPQTWLMAFRERRDSWKEVREANADVWVTYHTYYKAPDILGPYAARRLNIPYVIFQGIYSTKRKRDKKTFPGFLMNRRALLAADFVFTNKRTDFANLSRIIPPEKLEYIRPGLEPKDFTFSKEAREELRSKWRITTPVILTAAMFRDDVKTQGLVWQIETLGKLAAAGHEFTLVLAGDGVKRTLIEETAARHLPGRTLFLGAVRRERLSEIYSAADVFVFPGINESLGMVYLEAQSCGLPAVAFNGWGVLEAITDGETGLLSPPFDRDAFVANIRRLLIDQNLRRALGRRAAEKIRQEHNLRENYRLIEKRLYEVLNRYDKQAS